MWLELDSSSVSCDQSTGVSDCPESQGRSVDILMLTSLCKASLDEVRPSEQLPGTFVFCHDRRVLKALIIN